MKIVDADSFSRMSTFDNIERALKTYVERSYAEGEIERVREHSERVLAVLVSVVQHMPTRSQHAVFFDLGMDFEP